MKIYTRTGDQGQTGLWGGERVSKSDPRVAAYGDVDELNSAVGCALTSAPQGAETLREALARIQEELFIVGALLASREAQRRKLSPPFDEGLPPNAVKRLEKDIDIMTAQLPAMTKFIMPGGGPCGSMLHLARTICRRAERAVVGLSDEPPPAGVLVYINRLSDFLFTAARWVNHVERKPETEWQGLSKKG